MNNLENDLSRALKLDAPVGSLPLARWHRKALETSMISNNSLNMSTNQSFTVTKTPSKTPRKTPGKQKHTPSGRKTPKTPVHKNGDRFIANRSTTNYELSHFKLIQQENQCEEMTASRQAMQKVISENLLGTSDINSVRVISYQSKPPKAPEGHLNSLRVLYSQTRTPGSAAKSTRYIPHTADRILDAPNILDDYYLNLIDWSSSNILAVCLNNHVFLWNATSGEIEELVNMENADDYVCSVSWLPDAYYLSVGTSDGNVLLYDVEKLKKLRVMDGHSARVSSLSWNQHILSSGSRSGAIFHHDVRVPQHHVGSSLGHTQEVCGLRWSPDGRYLASGGNDNLLNIWPVVSGNGYSAGAPVYKFSQHLAAVKALSWCPWQPSLLASGGGTSDRNIRFWNCNSGTLINNIDTKSQISGILWNEEYKELISSHGFSNNQLIMWKYPSMTKVAELYGHTARILNICGSPDGTTVVSASADETLRLWKCFETDRTKKKEVKKTVTSKCALNCIR